MEGVESLLFRETQDLKFDSRSLIVFVQTSQPIQSNLQPITMRIIALHKDLTPYTGERRGHCTRQWAFGNTLANISLDVSQQFIWLHVWLSRIGCSKSVSSNAFELKSPVFRMLESALNNGLAVVDNHRFVLILRDWLLNVLFLRIKKRNSHLNL